MTPRTDPALARDVAKHLDRRRIRRRLLVWTALLAAVVVAAMYATCGQGFGLGGAGPGSGEGSGPGSGAVKALAGPKRCAIRVTAAGIYLDGKPALRDEAVATCKAAAGADVVITGDAREGDWNDLRSALGIAGVRDIVVRQPPRP
jgi:hypothetical protein